MVYQGYLAIGGEDGVGTTELINAERTYAYVQHLAPSLGVRMPDGYESPELPVLLGHGGYSAPLSDLAPWVDVDNSDSMEFLGLFPTSLSGFGSSTWHSDTVEYVTDGGVAVGGRNEGREIMVRALMLAASPGGMDAGMTWLRNVLTDADCRDDPDCGGESLIALSAPPSACEDDIGEVAPGQVHPCLAPYVRQYYRVSCTEGFTIRNEWTTDCGPMYEVEFLLYAGVPQPHLLPQFIGMAQSEALITHVNMVTDPSFEDGTADEVTGSEYVDFEVASDWAAYGNNSLKVTPHRQDPRLRTNHVLNPSLEDGSDGWTPADPVPLVDYEWTGAADASPSTRTTMGSGTLTNLVENPRGRNTSGTVTVMENLVTNPRGRDTVTPSAPAGDLDVWIAAGQSNMDGRGTAAQSPAPPATALRWDGSAIVALTQDKSLLPAFSRAMDQRLGRSSLFVETAVGGTALLADNAQSQGDWSPIGTLFGDSVAAASAALSAAATDGYTVASVNVLWHQGERDAQGGANLGAYQDALEALVDRYRTALARPDLKVYLWGLGTTPNEGPGWQIVRDAQQAAAASAGVVMVYDRCTEFFDLGWMNADDIHYNQQGLNDMGLAGGQAVADDLMRQVTIAHNYDLAGTFSQGGSGYMSAAWNGATAVELDTAAFRTGGQSLRVDSAGTRPRGANVGAWRAYNMPSMLIRASVWVRTSPGATGPGAAIEIAGGGVQFVRGAGVLTEGEWQLLTVDTTLNPDNMDGSVYVILGGVTSGSAWFDSVRLGEVDDHGIFDATAWNGNPDFTPSAAPSGAAILTAPRPVGWGGAYYSTSRDMIASIGECPATFDLGSDPGTSTLVVETETGTSHTPHSGALVTVTESYFRAGLIDGTDSYTGDYWDGHTPTWDSDLTVAFTGAEDASTSVVTAPAPVGVNVPAGYTGYYSASRDAIALTSPDQAYITFSGLGTPNDSTMLAEIVDTSDGLPVTMDLYRLTPKGGAGEVTVNVGGTIHSGIPATSTGAFVWLIPVSSMAGRTVYFRAALIDGTDTYEGYFWDGHMEDVGASEWTTDRADVGFSGDWSLAASCQVGGGAYSVTIDLQEISSRKAAALYAKPDMANPAPAVLARTEFLDAAGATVDTVVGTYPISAGGWARVTAVSNDAGAVTQMRVAVSPASAAGDPLPYEAGDRLLLDAALVEDANIPGTYFDGDTPDVPGEVIYSWMPQNGGSIATILGEILSDRTFVDLTDGQDLAYGVEPGQDYHLWATLHTERVFQVEREGDARTVQMVWTTYSGSQYSAVSAPAPNTVGDHRIRLDFTVPDNVSGAHLRLYSGVDGATWWDGLMLSETVPDGYFDGDTPDADGWTYTWAGAVQASASVAEYNPIPPETVPDTVCDPDEAIITLRRNLLVNPAAGDPSGWRDWESRGNFTRSFVADDSRRPGGQSVRVHRDSGQESVYASYIRYLGYPDVPSRPRVQAGVRYTASVWVKMDRDGRARMSINIWDAGRSEIAEWRTAYITAPANTWRRMSMSFTPPQGAYSAGFHAWTYVAPYTEAPQGTTTWYTDALLEQSAVLEDYFDGSFTDTTELNYAWEGLANRSASVITEAESGDLLIDPDCEFIPPPPRPPVVDTMCVEAPAEWTRYSVLVASESVPLWGAAVPVVTLRTGSSAARQVRIRFYPLTDPLQPTAYNECSYDGEFILTYLPPSTSLTIDGVRRRAMASVGENPAVSALHLLTGTNGTPYEWTELKCDQDYLMTVDVAPLAEDATVSLDVVGRR